MQYNEIYIICTYNKRGRYIKTATTNQERAEALAALLIGLYKNAGFSLTGTKDVENGGEWTEDGPGIATVVKVYHLENPAGDFQNVEVYRVEDFNSKTVNNGK